MLFIDILGALIGQILNKVLVQCSCVLCIVLLQILMVTMFGSCVLYAGACCINNAQGVRLV